MKWLRRKRERENFSLRFFVNISIYAHVCVPCSSLIKLIPLFLYPIQSHYFFPLHWILLLSSFLLSVTSNRYNIYIPVVVYKVYFIPFLSSLYVSILFSSFHQVVSRGNEWPSNIERFIFFLSLSILLPPTKFTQ